MIKLRRHMMNPKYVSNVKRIYRQFTTCIWKCGHATMGFGIPHTMKLIEGQHCFIWECIEKNDIIMLKIHSKKNAMNPSMKALSTINHFKHHCGLMNIKNAWNQGSWLANHWLQSGWPCCGLTWRQSQGSRYMSMGRRWSFEVPPSPKCRCLQ